MLKIFNNLEPFFENNYKRINVREYARLKKISPPTASKLLSELQKEDLLEREDEKKLCLLCCQQGKPCVYTTFKTLLV